jgi:hypothetical protein
VGELRREREEAEESRRAAEADSQHKQKAVVELEEKLLEKNKRIQVKMFTPVVPNYHLKYLYEKFLFFILVDIGKA